MREAKELRAVLVCLMILGVACVAGLASEQGDRLGLMILRLKKSQGVFSPNESRPMELVEAVLGKSRRTQQPHVVGIFGVSDAREVEELIWPLNRTLGPDEATFVTWLTGGGPDGEKMAVLSLFPLVGYQDLFELGPRHKILYSMLDAPGGLLHVILVGDAGITHEGNSAGTWPEKALAGLVGIILRQDPTARIVLMGDLRPDLLLQSLKDKAWLGCVFCPDVAKNPLGAIMAHPAELATEEAAIEIVGKSQMGRAVKVQWTPLGK